MTYLTYDNPILAQITSASGLDNNRGLSPTIQHKMADIENGKDGTLTLFAKSLTATTRNFILTVS